MKFRPGVLKWFLCAAAGSADMLAQSRMGSIAQAMNATAMKPEIERLPALPSAWPNDGVEGLQVRGGAVADMSWSNGKPASARILPLRGCASAATGRYGRCTAITPLRTGAEARLNSEPQCTHP